MDAPSKTVTLARRLRRTMTPPELRLWSVLRTRPDGLKFRRQHPFDHFVLDFYCDAAKLAIEVDGAAHDFGDRPARDIARDAFLRTGGVAVFRVLAEEVRVNLEGVVAGILAEASLRLKPGSHPLHHPSGGPPPPTGAETQRGAAAADPGQARAALVERTR